MDFGRQEHRRMVEWGIQTGTLAKFVAAGEALGMAPPVVVLATPDTLQGQELLRTAKVQGCADEASRRFAAQRRARVPRFLVGIATVADMLAGLAPQTRADLEAAVATGDVPMFVFDDVGYWCGTLVAGPTVSS